MRDWSTCSQQCASAFFEGWNIKYITVTDIAYHWYYFAGEADSPHSLVARRRPLPRFWPSVRNRFHQRILPFPQPVLRSLHNLNLRTTKTQRTTWNSCKIELSFPYKALNTTRKRRTTGNACKTQLSSIWGAEYNDHTVDLMIWNLRHNPSFLQTKESDILMFYQAEYTDLSRKFEYILSQESLFYL